VTVRKVFGSDFIGDVIAHQFHSVARFGCLPLCFAAAPPRQGIAGGREEIQAHHLRCPPRFPPREQNLGSLLPFFRAAGSLFAAAAGRGFLESLFDRFTGFAGALLNAAQQFVVLAFGKLKIIVRELGPLLFQLAFGDVPVAFAFEFVHNNSFFVLA
jgi:hypothetical protein